MLSKKVVGAIVALLLAYYLSNKRISVSKNEGRTVETKTGSIRGITSLSRDGREFYEWLGIPYAKPPEGRLRFAPPQPLDRQWEGVRDGSFYRSACAQFDLSKGKILGEEDCLFLNIHAPKLKDSEKLLPVLVWIHGGSFMSGSGEQTKPNYFMDEDVILVTINYRLGALGFLSTGDSVVRGNMGLKDQSMAIKWVHENIVNFGGDAEKLTVAGHSSGSAAVHLQLLSPMSRGLIHRAISQCGSALNIWAINEDPGRQAKNFARKVNCPTDSSSEILKCLRNVELNTVLQVHAEATAVTSTIENLFLPVVESISDQEAFLSDKPLNLLNTGNFSRVPWLAGFNKDEGLALTLKILKDEEFRKNLENDWNLMDQVNLYLTKQEKQFNKKIKEFYFGKGELDLLSNLEAAKNLMTDRWFSYGMHKAALIHSKFAPTQFYFYTKTGPSLVNLMMMIDGKWPVLVDLFIGLTKEWFSTSVLGKQPVSYGVSHGDEIAMLFETLAILSVPKGHRNYQFSKDLVKAWVSFASESNVADANFRGMKFPLVDPKEEVEVKVTEINEVPKIIKFPFPDRIRFWKSIDVNH